MKTILQISFLAFLTQTIMAQENKIIFVCEHGAAKSVIAASYFNKMAKERNLDYVAQCRGTFPDSVVSPAIKQNLTREKVFDPNTKTQKLSISDTANVARIILFTNLPPAFKTDIKTENWSAIQDIDGDYEKRKNAIVKKISELLDSLEKH
jgi:arsenate reductase (thioredoxin)